MVNSIQFKSNATAVSYNNRRTAPMPANNGMDDVFMLQEMEMQKAQKKEKSRDRWNKAGVMAQIGIAAAFLTTAGIALLGVLGLKKLGAKGGSAADAYTTVKLKWEDFAKEKSVAALDSKTTSKTLRDAFKKIIDSRGLSEKAKKWGGSSDNKMDIMYLYGHGGVGKTYVAKQYAQETGSLFTCIKYPDLGSPYKDAASMKISSAFDNIVEHANKMKDRKIVVCIDEIDAVMRKVPDGQHGAEEVAKSRAAVLTGLDKLRDKCKNVTVITTSNYHPKNGIVDPIALRRFNNKIKVPLPDKEQIPALLEMYMKDIGAATEAKFFKTNEFKNFAKKLEKGGYSNGEIELIAKEAGKIFSSSLKGVADADLKRHPFKIKYLEEALKMNGEAASKTNKLMDVKKAKAEPKAPKTYDELNWFQKLIYRALGGRKE